MRVLLHRMIVLFLFTILTYISYFKFRNSLACWSVPSKCVKFMEMYYYIIKLALHWQLEQNATNISISSDAYVVLIWKKRAPEIRNRITCVKCDRIEKHHDAFRQSHPHVTNMYFTKLHRKYSIVDMN